MRRNEKNENIALQKIALLTKANEAALHWSSPLKQWESWRYSLQDSRKFENLGNCMKFLSFPEFSVQIAEIPKKNIKIDEFWTRIEKTQNLMRTYLTKI